MNRRVLLTRYVVYKSRLLVYDAGDTRTTWVSFWKAMALLQFGTTLVFAVPPLWNNENQPNPDLRKAQAILGKLLFYQSHDTLHICSFHHLHRYSTLSISYTSHHFRMQLFTLLHYHFVFFILLVTKIAELCLLFGHLFLSQSLSTLALRAVPLLKRAYSLADCWFRSNPNML